MVVEYTWVRIFQSLPIRSVQNYWLSKCQGGTDFDMGSTTTRQQYYEHICFLNPGKLSLSKLRKCLRFVVVLAAPIKCAFPTTRFESFYDGVAMRSSISANSEIEAL